MDPYTGTRKGGTHGGRWSRLWNRCSHHGNKSANGATVRRRGETSEGKSGNPRGPPGRPFARAKNINGKNERSPRGGKPEKKRSDLVSHSYEAEVTVDQRFRKLTTRPPYKTQTIRMAPYTHTKTMLHIYVHDDFQDCVSIPRRCQRVLTRLNRGKGMQAGYPSPVGASGC